MTMVKSLDESYDKFYYAELPKFHMKNVIEYKRGVTNLYTGSFNILSFCINGSEEHYRMEQMTFANHKEADLHRNEYIALFLNRYVQIFKEKISSCARGQSLDLTKIDYLSSICESKQETEELMYAAKDAGIEVHVDKMPNEQGLIDLAQKVIDLPHNKDPRYIQAKWAAILYKFEYSKKKKDLKRQSLAEFDFQRFICFNSVHQVCRISMRKGKIDHKKSIVNIVCNDINFEFAEINLPRKSFDILNKHKQRIFFQEENIKSTRFTLNKVLFTSIREIGIK